MLRNIISISNFLFSVKETKDQKRYSNGKYLGKDKTRLEQNISHQKEGFENTMAAKKDIEKSRHKINVIRNKKPALKIRSPHFFNEEPNFRYMKESEKTPFRRQSVDNLKSQGLNEDNETPMIDFNEMIDKKLMITSKIPEISNLNYPKIFGNESDENMASQGNETALDFSFGC